MNFYSANNTAVGRRIAVG